MSRGISTVARKSAIPEASGESLEFDGETPPLFWNIFILVKFNHYNGPEYIFTEGNMKSLDISSSSSNKSNSEEKLTVM